MAPPLGMTTSLTGGEQLGSFGGILIIVWMRSGPPGRTEGPGVMIAGVSGPGRA